MKTSTTDPSLHSSALPAVPREPSPESTQHSIDFGALADHGHAESSLLSLDIPSAPLDVVNSEDIDGPSDFTQNMEYWMHAKLPNVVEPVVLEEEEAVKDLEEYIASDEEDSGGKGRLEDEHQRSMEESFEDHGELLATKSVEELRNKALTMTDASNREAGSDSGSESGSSRAAIAASTSVNESPSEGSPTVTTEQHDEPLTLAHNHSSQRLTYRSENAQREAHEDNDHPPKSTESLALQPTVENHQNTLLGPPLTTGAMMPNVESKAPSEQGRALLHQDMNQQTVKSDVRIADLEDLLAQARVNLSQSRMQLQDALDREATSREVLKSHAETSATTIDALEQRNTDLITRIQRKDLEREAHIQEVQSSCQRRLAENEATSSARIEFLEARIERMRFEHNQRQSDFQTQMGQAEEKRKREVETQKLSAEAKIADLETQIQGLHSRLAQLTDNARKELGNLEEKHRADLEGHKQQAAAKAAELESRIAKLANQHHHSPTSDSLDTVAKDESAEESAPVETLDNSYRDVVAALQKQSAAFEAINLGMTERIVTLERSVFTLQSNLEEASTKVRQTQTELEMARESAETARKEHEAQRAIAAAESRKIEAERQDLEEENAELESNYAALRTGMASMRKQHQEEVQAVRTKAEDAVRKVGQLLEREKAENIAACRAADAAKEDTEALRAELLASRNALKLSADKAEDFHTQLQKQKVATQAAQAKAASAQEELFLLREDFEAVNQTVDERIVKLMQAREKEWQQRFDILVKERKVMGKALMHGWGREECGLEEPQKYKYQCLDR